MKQSISLLENKKMSGASKIPAAEGLDIVVIGSFNPAIFHPEWFLRQKLVREEEIAEPQINAISKEICDFSFSGMKLFCMNDRFSIGTTNISKSARMQDLLINTFTILSHTPVTACGINPTVAYTVKDDKLWHKIGNTLAPKDLVWNELFEKPGMNSLCIKAPHSGEFAGDTFLWVEPAQDPRIHPGIFVRANYSYNFPKDPENAEATELLLKFLTKDWDVACALARKLGEVILEKIKPDE
jgi:hypothetical protein